MYVAKKCVYLGCKETQGKDRVYQDVHLEFENDEVMSVPVGQGVNVAGIKKYTEITAWLEIVRFGRDLYMRFGGVVDGGK